MSPEPPRPEPTIIPPPATLGVVAIGRNEGPRLIACLESIADRAALAVYVDSGSTDGSVEAARALGVEVVSLDLSIPFTAARARNAGLDCLLERRADLPYVQFVDGDCEVVDGWLELARAELEARADLAVACGRRRERFPEATIYNRLADLEWETPIGDASACGGDALMRVEALRQVGGFDPTLIAGEEPDLCVRLRAIGWKVARLDAEMTRHDLAMTRFSQWWRRNVRAGFAYAEGTARHGGRPGRPWVRQASSNWIWGLGLPVATVALAWPTGALSLVGLLGYPLIAWRAARGRARRGTSIGQASLFGIFCALGKAPQAIGQVRYVATRLAGRRSALIEYKGDARPASVGGPGI